MKVGRNGAHDHKRVVVGTAEEILHDIFLHSLELNLVKTVEKATELLWPAESMEANGGAFKLILRNRLDPTQPKEKGEHEECIDATVSVGNGVLRTHGLNPYQQVFGHGPEVAFDALVSGVDEAGVTMHVLDCPGERVRTRQAARQAS